MIRTLDLEALAKQYQEAKPFPHIVLHDIVDESVLNEVEAEFPDIKKVESVVYDNPLEIKNITSGPQGIGKTTQVLIDYFNSETFLNILQKITGIEEKLVADPKLMGGGLHEVPNGGLLKLHVDFNKHYETGYDRRVNLLLYLNKDWLPEYGGNIELWNRDLNECGASVSPTFNTMVIFNTTEWSWHGHPDAVNCPEDRKRKSLALYYYSDGRPEHEKVPNPHNSVWGQRRHPDGTIYEADKDVEKLANGEH